MALWLGTRFTCPSLSSAELDGDLNSSFLVGVGHVCFRVGEWISKSGVQKAVMSVSTFLWVISLKEIGCHEI